MLSTDCSAKVPTSWTINAGFPCCQRINSAFLFEYLQILSRQWWLYLNKSVYCVGCLDSAHRVNLNCVFTSLCVYSQCRWRTGESALWMICLSPSKPSLSRMVLVSDIPLWYLGRSTEMVRHTQTHRHTHTHTYTHTNTRIHIHRIVQAYRICECLYSHTLSREHCNIVLQMMLIHTVISV